MNRRFRANDDKRRASSLANLQGLTRDRNKALRTTPLPVGGVAVAEDGTETTNKALALTYENVR
jgi:hypothetical protein